MEENQPRIKNYVCFVCSLMIESLEEFRTHIVQNHEEGTDYITCPCDNCKIPVRDLKTHYAVKHPEHSIPSGYPTRPIIIRDARVKKGKKKVTKFKTGSFYSKKNNKDLYFRSGLESEFYKILEKRRDVLNYSVEALEIEYYFEGYTHRYIPDILVEFTDGRKELWEIKPKSQTKLPKNTAKWSAANEYCKKRNWKFIVLTENGLKMLKKGRKI